MERGSPEPIFDPERIRFNAASARKAANSAVGAWGTPLHGVWVYVADGRVLGTIRTLGTRLPAADQVKALRIDGVQFFGSPTRVIPRDHWMPICGFHKVANAKAYASKVFELMRANPNGLHAD